MKNPLPGVRDRAGWFDHLIRAVARYQGDGGDRLAASVTFFGFLSFFPVLALAVAVLGFATIGNAAASQTVIDQVDAFSPGLANNLGLADLLADPAVARRAASLGLVGLLYAGLGWVNALREAIRSIWHHNVSAGNVVVKKLKDVVILVGLGVTLLVSTVVSGFAGTFTGTLLGWIGLDGSIGGRLVVTVTGLLLSVGVTFLLFLYVFTRLPRLASPLREVAKGALLGAVLFEVLKQVGGIYIARTTDNPVFGPFAVVVGLLVWINLASRLLLLCAAWTVTGPYDADTPPSGTASPDLAEEAGIGRELGEGLGDAPTLEEDGAPTRLRDAVNGVEQPQAAGETGTTRDASSPRSVAVTSRSTTESSSRAL